MMGKSLSIADVPELCDTRLSLTELKTLGWWIEYSSSGSWWFRHTDQRRVSAPLWAHEVEETARQRGEKSVQDGIKRQLGLRVKE